MVKRGPSMASAVDFSPSRPCSVAEARLRTASPVKVADVPGRKAKPAESMRLLLRRVLEIGGEIEPRADLPQVRADRGLDAHRARHVADGKPEKARLRLAGKVERGDAVADGGFRGRQAVEMGAGALWAPEGIVREADRDVEGLALRDDQVIRQRVDSHKGVALDIRRGPEPAQQGVPAGLGSRHGHERDQRGEREETDEVTARLALAGGLSEIERRSLARDLGDGGAAEFRRVIRGSRIGVGKFDDAEQPVAEAAVAPLDDDRERAHGRPRPDPAAAIAPGEYGEAAPPANREEAAQPLRRIPEPVGGELQGI